MKRPVILQVIPQLDTGGAELSTVEIAGAIATAGGRALVVTEGGRMAEAIMRAGGEIVPMPVATKNPLTIYRNAARIAQLIAAENVDLVHARSRAPAWSALWAARRTKRPFVTTYHGAYAEKGPLKRAYNSVMAEGDRVIANSAYTAGLVMGRYGTNEANVRIIHRGVDEVAFDPARLGEDRLAALRAAWRLPDAPPVILQAARLTRWKGQTVLIEALGKLAKAQPDLPWIAILAG
ncbi:MAG: glycosyltransferase, partial [Hyphomicrobiaceae bacterium]|nr:glycosyltransferase [Hyphomicrobiaceae bacterium]